MEISISIVQAMMGVSRRTVYRLLKEGTLKSLDPWDVSYFIAKNADHIIKLYDGEVPVSSSSSASPILVNDTSLNTSPDPSWANKPAPYTLEEEEVQVSSSSSGEDWLVKLEREMEEREAKASQEKTDRWGRKL